jgi:hypothetical protein
MCESRGSSSWGHARRETRAGGQARGDLPRAGVGVRERCIGSANLISVSVEHALDGRSNVQLAGGGRGEAITAAATSRPERLRFERLEFAANEPLPRIDLPVMCSDVVFQGALAALCLARCVAGSFERGQNSIDRLPVTTGYNSSLSFTSARASPK